MTKRRNPPGYPLSAEVFEAEDGTLVVPYRPRIDGVRRRVQVPAVLAERHEKAHLIAVEDRHNLADELPRRRRRRKTRAKKAAAPKAPAKRRARKKAPPRPARTVTKVEPRKRTHSSRDVVKTRSRAPAAAAPAAAAEPQLALALNPARGVPNLGRVGVVTSLARVEELIVERPDGTHERHVWKRNRPHLVWSPKTRTLFWVHGREPTQVRRTVTRADGAARIYERFTGRSPIQTGILRVPSTPLRAYGRPVSLIYRSDKWGPRNQRIVRYEHEFSDRVRVFVAPGRGRKGPVFALRGGRLTLTERGIVF